MTEDEAKRDYLNSLDSAVIVGQIDPDALLEAIRNLDSGLIASLITTGRKGKAESILSAIPLLLDKAEHTLWREQRARIDADNYFTRHPNI